MMQPQSIDVRAIYSRLNARTPRTAGLPAGPQAVQRAAPVATINTRAIYARVNAPSQRSSRR